MADDPEAIGDAGNVVSLEEFRDKRANGDGALDDDEIIRRAGQEIAEWKAAGTPSLTEVQTLFHESICAGASAMARDRIVAAILATFDEELGGKRALVATWNKLVKDFAAELLNHFIGSSKKSGRDGEAERLGGLQVDDHKVFQRQLHRKFRRLCATENVINIAGTTVK